MNKINGTKPLVSVVMPCLNEEEAIGSCIEQIKKVFNDNEINGEIIVCDNGSTDKSAAIAKNHGVKVIYEPLRGYGRAYLKGLAHANGEYLIMADADDTYDFNEIPNFLNKLVNEGFDFVTGSRYMKGFEDNSMSFLHRYIGNPILTRILNFLFGLNYSDVYSGFRGFRRTAYECIRPVSPGMEFNLELAINAKLAKLRVAEIPIMLHKRKGESKLRTFKDGWRSLRMMLLYCPNKVFLWPGTSFFIWGLALHLITLTGIAQYQGRALSNVTGIIAIIFSVIGFEILNLGVHVKTYSWTRRFEKYNILLLKFYRIFTLEKGIIIGITMATVGFVILTGLVVKWVQSDLLPLPHPEWAAFSATMLIIGSNIIFSSLFISAMSMKKVNNASAQ